jgi:hypothetical protein
MGVMSGDAAVWKSTHRHHWVRSNVTYAASGRDVSSSLSFPVLCSGLYPSLVSWRVLSVKIHLRR